MITKADIKQETNSVSYNRGKKIYEEQKVHAFQVQEMEDIFGYQLHKITAVVDGSGKNMYCVSVSVDEEMSEIMEDDCDCPAHEQYWGLCKHCVAVLLYYLEWRKKERKKLEEKVRNDEEHQELEQLLRAVGVKRMNILNTMYVLLSLDTCSAVEVLLLTIVSLPADSVQQLSMPSWKDNGT